MVKEEVCGECKNTNGEHKPGCSRGLDAIYDRVSERVNRHQLAFSNEKTLTEAAQQLWMAHTGASDYNHRPDEWGEDFALLRKRLGGWRPSTSTIDARAYDYFYAIEIAIFGCKKEHCCGK